MDDSTYIRFYDMDRRDEAVSKLDSFGLFFSSPNTGDLRHIRIKSPITDARVIAFLAMLANANVQVEIR